MATTFDNVAPIALGDTAASSRTALHWLSPVIVGLTAPAIAVLLLLPALAAHAGAFITLLLALALLVSVLAYAATVFVPTDPIGIEIDRRARLVNIVMASPFAIKRMAFDFADIVSLRFATFYDQDGYSQNGAELTTSDGDVIEFTADLTPADIESARRALGLRDAAARAI